MPLDVECTKTVDGESWRMGNLIGESECILQFCRWFTLFVFLLRYRMFNFKAQSFTLLGVILFTQITCICS